MNKSIIKSILFVLLMNIAFVAPAFAQGGIFIMEDEEEIGHMRTGMTSSDFNFPDVTPDHDTTWDYTPLGSGIWLLGALGGAYLLGKRRKDDTQLPSK